MLKYYVPDRHDPADAIELPKNYHPSSNPVDFVEQAAAHYHNQRSGWDAHWPVIFVVVAEDGTETKWDVDRIPVPQFEAIQIK
jgi:hypothetical protein